jgi:selenide,water dikinase
LKKNSTTSVGNKLILGKPLGIGIYSAALKKGLLSTLQYNLLVDSTTKLNSIGTDFGKLKFVNAMTDITGFGLLGHLDEMARSSNTTIKVNSNKILSYPGINNLIEKGCITGASERNLQALASEVLFADSVSKVDKSLLTDPQTSGGLLVSVESNRANVILDMFKNQDYEASIVGEVIEENPKYRILVVNE